MDGILQDETETVISRNSDNEKLNVKTLIEAHDDAECNDTESDEDSCKIDGENGCKRIISSYFRSSPPTHIY